MTVEPTTPTTAATNTLATTHGKHGHFLYEIIQSNGTAPLLQVSIPPSATFTASPGRMVASDGNVTVKGCLKRSVKALMLPSDEGRYAQYCNKSSTECGRVLLAPAGYGQIVALRVADGGDKNGDGGGGSGSASTCSSASDSEGSQEGMERGGDGTGGRICVQDAGAILATIGEVAVTTRRQTMKALPRALLAGAGPSSKTLAGNGVAFLACVGASHALALRGGEEACVAVGHLLAWGGDMRVEYRQAGEGGWLRSAVVGEGMVAVVKGPGVVVLQSRSAADVAGFIYDSKAPPQRNLPVPSVVG